MFTGKANRLVLLFALVAIFFHANFARASFLPSDLSNLKLWVEIDYGLFYDLEKTLPSTTHVKVWADRSGNGNDLINDCVNLFECSSYFSGADSLSNTYLRATNYGNPFIATNLGAHSYFTGSILDASYNTALTIFDVEGIAFGGDEDWSMPDMASFTGGYGWYFNRQQNFATKVLTGTDLAIQDTASRLAVNVFRYDGAHRTIWHDLNKATDNLTGNLNLTGRIKLAGAYKDALLVYNRALSDAEVLQVQTYLRNKYMRPTAPQIMFDGNSLTYGIGTTDSVPGGLYDAVGQQFPEEVYWAMPDHNIHNFGSLGETTTQMETRAGPQVDIYYDPARPQNILVGWEGTNDLANDGLTAAQSYTLQNTYFNNRRSAGWKTIALTVLPRNTGEGTFEGRRQTLNTSMKNGFNSFANALVDVGSDPNIGAVGQDSNLTYFADGIHLTNAGYQIVADYVTAAIRALEAPLTSLTGTTISSVGNTSANFTWTTNASSSSLVEIGTGSTVSASSTESDTTTRVKSHSFSLTGLKPCTSYVVRAMSNQLDPNGIVRLAANAATSSLFRIETTGCTGGSAILASSTASIASTTGGSLTLLDGSNKGITITVPAGFVTSSSSAVFQAKKLNSVTFASSAGAPSGKTMVGTQVFNLSASPTPTSNISTFLQPITVKLTYATSDIAGLDESALTIYRYDGSAWTALSGCSVDTALKTVSCTTTGFSDFAVFGAPPVAQTATTIAVASQSSFSPEAREKYLVDTYGKQKADEILGNNSTVNKTFSFSKDLKFTMHDPEIVELQKFLNKSNFTVALSGPGSIGNETDFFGLLTREALIKYQKANNIYPTAGYFGPLTRKSIAK